LPHFHEPLDRCLVRRRRLSLQHPNFSDTATTPLIQVGASCRQALIASYIQYLFACVCAPFFTGVSSPAGGRTGSGGGRNPGTVTQTDNLLVATHSKALQVGPVDGFGHSRLVE
jgi:hypothetical protein